MAVKRLIFLMFIMQSWPTVLRRQPATTFKRNPEKLPGMEYQLEYSNNLSSKFE